MVPFSVIVFGVVVWTIAVSGAKQLRFRLKTKYCGRGLSRRKKKMYTKMSSVDGSSVLTVIYLSVYSVQVQSSCIEYFLP